MPKNMSAEGRARIVAAQKKRWEAIRAKELADKAAAATDIQASPPLEEAFTKTQEVAPEVRAVTPEVDDLGGIPEPAEPVYELHRCIRCGWEIRNKTFLQAITAHTEFHARDGRECRPSLTQPSAKFLKRELMLKLQNNPRSVSL